MNGKVVLLLLTLTPLLSGCLGFRHLEDGEKLLYKQKIEGVENADKNDISQLITLKPNNRIPLIGALGANIYETGENNFDTAKINDRKEAFISKIDTKISQKKAENRSTKGLEARKQRKLDRISNRLRNGNLLMRTGVPLAIYDSVKIEESRQRIETYLRHKGFLEGRVENELKSFKRHVIQTFNINEGPRSYIDSIGLKTGDTTITRLITANQNLSLMKKGDYYDRDLVDQERSRIHQLLRNNGYFNLSDQFINFEVQYAPNTTDLWFTTVINKPADKDFHQRYTLDTITFDATGREAGVIDRSYKGIHYTFGDIRYSTKVLDGRLIFRPGEKYSYDKVVNTQRQLLSMDMFKYVNINFDEATIPGKFATNIYTAPLKRYELGQEFGLNMREGIPGPFYNLSLKNRNTFKGAEILTLNGFINIEGIASAADEEGALRSFQYGGNLALTFPRFIAPFNINNLNLKTFNPRTSVSTGFSFIDRPEYTRSNLNGTYSYTWQNLKGDKNYRLNIADINLIDTLRISSDFREQLQVLESQGNTLIRAFSPSFVSSSSINAIYNNDYANPDHASSFLRWFIEVGGNIYDITGTGLLRNNNLEFYRFAKFQVDLRRFWPINRQAAFVARFNLGLAAPYSSNKTLPYEKFFFAGGSSSNRAWKPRRLGPGSVFPLHEDGSPDRNNFRFEQPGEILLEASVEYRDNLVGFLDWAWFVDMGNVWRIRGIDDGDLLEERTVSTGENFEFDRFYKEIAIGTGLGLRLDFSFLVFRIDTGVKVYDPRYPESKRWQKPFKRASQTVWNIAVGYPF